MLLDPTVDDRSPVFVRHRAYVLVSTSLLAVMVLVATAILVRPAAAQLRPPPSVITTQKNAVDGRLLNPNVPRNDLNGPVTAFACSKQTLIADVPCVFVGKRPRVGALPHPNTQRREIQAFFLDACLVAVPSRPKDCERKAADAAFTCAHAASLQDAHGNFPPEAGECYRALTDALDDVRSLATFQSSCCRCASACAPATQCSDATRLPALRGECVSMCANVCGLVRTR